MSATARPGGPPRLTPWTFVQRVAAGVLWHESMSSSAQIAYYLLFATFPCLFALASLLAFRRFPTSSSGCWLRWAPSCPRRRWT